MFLKAAFYSLRTFLPASGGLILRVTTAGVTTAAFAPA